MVHTNAVCVTQVFLNQVYKLSEKSKWEILNVSETSQIRADKRKIYPQICISSQCFSLFIQSVILLNSTTQFRLYAQKQSRYSTITCYGNSVIKVMLNLITFQRTVIFLETGFLFLCKHSSILRNGDEVGFQSHMCYLKVSLTFVSQRYLIDSWSSSTESIRIFQNFLPHSLFYSLYLVRIQLQYLVYHLCLQALCCECLASIQECFYHLTFYSDHIRIL